MVKGMPSNIRSRICTGPNPSRSRVVVGGRASRRSSIRDRVVSSAPGMAWTTNPPAADMLPSGSRYAPSATVEGVCSEVVK